MNRRYAVLVTVIVAALAYLIYGGVRSAAVYYVTVGELLERGEAAVDVPSRVAGTVASGSIRREGSRIRFTLRDEGIALPVVYQGTVPDLFTDEAEVVVEGQLRRDGVFAATVLLAKCPTRYERDT
ncbi:MAG: cytochrome c maturation protein CcmE [Armatimonadota bacterium]|nr:cytochrome c maturation protein CcmE [Armatimonadota bacterium]MDR5698107.1 cytochrome c maturation protein CcmE [Armatimonadota bacterium]